MITGFYGLDVLHCLSGSGPRIGDKVAVPPSGLEIRPGVFLNMVLTENVYFEVLP